MDTHLPRHCCACSAVRRTARRMLGSCCPHYCTWVGMTEMMGGGLLDDWDDDWMGGLLN